MAQLQPVSSGPDGVAFVQDGGPRFAEPVAVDAPRADRRLAAHLLDQELAAGNVCLTSMGVVSQHIADEPCADLATRELLEYLGPCAGAGEVAGKHDECPDLRWR